MTCVFEIVPPLTGSIVFDEALPDGEAARGAGAFDPGGRDRHLGQVVGHQRAEVLLAHEQTARHTAHVHRIDVVDAGVVDGVQGGLDEDVADRLLPELAPLLHSDADDRNVSHRVTSWRGTGPDRPTRPPRFHWVARGS